MSGIYLILQNPKPQTPSPKSQAPSLKLQECFEFGSWNLEFGIWDLELYSMNLTFPPKADPLWRNERTLNRPYH